MTTVECRNCGTMLIGFALRCPQCGWELYGKHSNRIIDGEEKPLCDKVFNTPVMDSKGNAITLTTWEPVADDAPKEDAQKETQEERENEKE